MRLRLFTTALFLLVFMLPAGAQDPQLITQIRKECSVINSDTGYQVIAMENEVFLEQMTDRGGSLTGLYKAGKVRKINEWVGFSYWITITEYYFRDGQLIFCYNVHKRFPYDEKQEKLDETRTETAYEGRFYYHKGKLISKTETGTRLDGKPAAPDWYSLSKDYVALLAAQ